MRERLVLLRLLQPDFPGRDELVDQAKSAVVLNQCDCGFNSIDIGVDDSLPSAPVTQFIPVEGVFPDVDGMSVAILLHVDGTGYITRLEFVRGDGGRLRSLPSADEIEVFAKEGVDSAYPRRDWKRQ